MLQLNIKGKEIWDERTQRFCYPSATSINLEHSLVSISKWESKWHKPFFSRLKHTEEETRDYIRCMSVTKGVNPIVYDTMSPDEINQVISYIEDPMSAIPVKTGNGSMRETITSEKIYAWMFMYQIPIECERWHITRLLNVIDLIDDSNTPRKKQSASATARQYAELNAQRRKALNTRG